MFEKVDMYIVKCDNCGFNAFEDAEFSCWADQGTAWDIANNESCFEEYEGKHYCEDCYSVDENDNVIISKAPAKDQDKDKPTN